MAVSTTGGAKFYVGPTNSTGAVAADFSALTYAEVKQIRSLGNFGASRNSVEYQNLGDDVVGNVSGSLRPGAMEVTCNRDPYDAGQAAMEAAQAGKLSYAFKLIMNDKVGAGTNTIYYFRGTVGGGSVQPGGNEDITAQVFQINNQIAPVKVAAT